MSSQTPLLFSAPGKVILFGEHAAVYGKPAIAAALSLRTYLLVTPPTKPEDHTITLEFSDIGFNHSWHTSELPWSKVTNDVLNTEELLPELVGALKICLKDIKQPFQHVAAYAFLYLYMCLTPKETPLYGTFLMKSTLPIGAGLGSSAAISVCLSAALLTLNNRIVSPLTEEEQIQEESNSENKSECSSNKSESNINKSSVDIIDHWAFISEKCIHGNPSGIDNTVSSHGGAVMFQRTNVANLPNIRTSISIPQINLLLTNTKHPRNTLDLVAGVAQLSTIMPETVTLIMDCIDNCVKYAFKIMCNTNDDKLDLKSTEEIRNLVRINHGLLVSLGVSHPTLEQIKSVADTIDIGETKLTGAGGGGCAITLLKDNITTSQLNEFKIEMEQKRKFEVFKTSLGGKGVAYLSPIDIINNKSSKNIFDAQVFIDLGSKQDIENTIGTQSNKWRYW